MVRILSYMVAPAGGSTPPVMTSPTSPSAWQPTTEMERMDCMGRTPRLPGATLLHRRLASSALDGRRRNPDKSANGSAVFQSSAAPGQGLSQCLGAPASLSPACDLPGNRYRDRADARDGALRKHRHRSRVPP